MIANSDTVRLITECLDHADDFVAEHERVGHAPVDQIQTSPAAEVVVALTQVRVGVAHPGADHSQQHLGACGCRGGQLHVGDGVIVLEDRERVHGCPRR
jgi:hypothetical protein